MAKTNTSTQTKVKSTPTVVTPSKEALNAVKLGYVKSADEYMAAEAAGRSGAQYGYTQMGTEAKPNLVANTKTKSDRNFASTSSTIRGEETKLSQDIQDALKTNQNMTGVFDINATKDSLKSLYDDERKLIQDRSNKLSEAYGGQTNSINQSFDEAKRQLGETQDIAEAKQSVGLAKIGGYLGASASSLGAVRNLEREHSYQIGDLEAKRAAAIQAAQTAYADQQFSLARSAMDSAKSYAEQRRQADQDFFNNSMKLQDQIKAEEKDKRDFAIEQTERAIDFAVESGEDLDPTELLAASDALGISVKVLQGAVNAKQATKALETKRDQTDYDIKLLNALSDIPKGSYVNIGGVTYQGLKSASQSPADIKATNFDAARSFLATNAVSPEADYASLSNALRENTDLTDGDITSLLSEYKIPKEVTPLDGKYGDIAEKLVKATDDVTAAKSYLQGGKIKSGKTLIELAPYQIQAISDEIDAKYPNGEVPGFWSTLFNKNK